MARPYASLHLIRCDRFGGKVPWFKDVLYSAAGRLGGFRRYQQIEWARVRRLVIACSGNICRSPYAEARARQLGMTAVSFGLNAMPGAPADADAIRHAAERGLRLARHRSRSSDMVSLQGTDLLVVMEPGQAARLGEWARAAAAQITLQGLWAPAPRARVPDPYGHGDACFRYSFALIDAALARMSRLAGNCSLRESQTVTGR